MPWQTKPPILSCLSRRWDGTTSTLLVTPRAALWQSNALRRPDLLHTLTLADSVPIQGSYSPPETLRLLAEMRHDTLCFAVRLPLLMPSLVSGIQDEDGEPAFFGLLVEDAAQMAPGCVHRDRAA